MKSRNYFFVIFFLFFPAMLSLAQSSPLVMIFIQPGGEGSSEEAQPILDKFFNLIQKNGGPKIQGKYYSSKSESAIAVGQAHLGIVSFNAYLELKKTRKIEVLLSTISLASGQPFESYYLLLHHQQPKNILKEENFLYLSEPVSQDFLNQYVFKNINQRYVPQGKPWAPSASQVFLKLKQLANHEIKGAILLTEYEYQSFKKLSFKWTKNLNMVYQSPPIPTAPVVMLNPLNSQKKELLVTALLNLHKSKEGKEILEILHLKRFHGYLSGS